MRVLMTGHQGYIGPVAVKVFKQAGLEVIGLDTGYFKDCLTKAGGVMAPDAEIVCDMRDVTVDHLRGMDAVMHWAALSNDPMGELSPDLTYDINLKSTITLARLAKEAGVRRFVMASSCSIYGASDTSRPLDETAEFNPVSAYAVSKVESEQALRELADDTFSPVFMRNATAFGVSPRTRLDLVLNNLMAVARATGEIRVLSDGTPWRPIVHIEDISQAAMCAVRAPREAVHCQAFNVGRSDMNYQVKDIAEAVGRAVPGSKVVIANQSGPDSRSYRVDFSKAAKLLPGFAPRWTLDDGCRELSEWLDTQGIGSSDDLNSPLYIRLRKLRALLGDKLVDEQLRWAQ
ncbi:NAD(P)-dependent oxidoreductase [Magnetospirillum sp. 15-1]|uniref:NAD-dependent epimerase/dehydratase family protein n=1 Tax=Magnetospirillum sp. 15-1 TaxID=1979370 RepID=UPI000BBC1660|nr:NAD(P)-dependent oxidoreductase [Magnetospirillum sp. 15-1]